MHNIAFKHGIIRGPLHPGTSAVLGVNPDIVQTLAALCMMISTHGAVYIGVML